MKFYYFMYILQIYELHIFIKVLDFMYFNIVYAISLPKTIQTLS